MPVQVRDKSHSYGPSNDIMHVLCNQKKEALTTTIERLHIHIEHAAGNHLNDDHIIFPNTLVKLNTPTPSKSYPDPYPTPPPQFNNTVRMNWPVSDEPTCLYQDSVFLFRHSI